MNIILRYNDIHGTTSTLKGIDVNVFQQYLKLHERGLVDPPYISIHEVKQCIPCVGGGCHECNGKGEYLKSNKTYPAILNRLGAWLEGVNQSVWDYFEGTNIREKLEFMKTKADYVGVPDSYTDAVRAMKSVMCNDVCGKAIIDVWESVEHLEPDEWVCGWSHSPSFVGAAVATNTIVWG